MNIFLHVTHILDSINKRCLTGYRCVFPAEHGEGCGGKERSCQVAGSIGPATLSSVALVIDLDHFGQSLVGIREP